MSQPTLASKGVNVAWLGQLEILEVQTYPLPGASVRRGTTFDVDPRLHVESPLSTDVLTFYEHVAAVRHKPSGRIYVAYRETMDTLLLRQQDPQKYPAWLLQHPVKQTELETVFREAYANPKRLKEMYGQQEIWFHRWLRYIEEDWVHETLSYFLLSNNFVKQQMFAKG
jgi:hypothetical protein